MYAIKMNADKTLQTTIHANIYQGEKNADTLVFLVPKLYGNQNVSECDLLMRYILPSGYGRSEALELALEPYNSDYYRYNLKLTTKLTELAGDIEIWLSAISLNDNVVFKTDSVEVTILPSKDITDYLNPESRDQLDMLSAKVSKLESEKADNIFYDEKEKYIQLSSTGKPIGDKLDMTKVGEDEVIDFDSSASSDEEAEEDPDGVIRF